MVQLVKYGTWYNTNVMRIDGLSTDTKPTDKFEGMAIPNGSIYTEIDTGDKYMFDAENKVWYKVSKNYVSLDEHGFVPLENLPPEIYERMYGVADDDARFDLTTDEVQNGDVVFVNDTQIMYLVVDDTKLDSEDGYQEFAAGIAAKAIADEDGRNIKNTYATKSELSAKQDEIDQSHKLDADLVDDTNSTNKFATSAQLSQIATNTTNIASNTTEIVGQENATSAVTPGRGYALINGIRLYVSDTEPTGTIPEGSLGIGF